MKATIASVAALLSLSSTVAAQNYTQSKPFTLTLKSSNSTLNGKALFSCHEGAAIEGLCVGNAPGQAYQFNTTDGQVATNKDLGKTGILTYELMGGNFNVSEAMDLIFIPSTNVAHAQFAPIAPYNAQQVGFDKSHKLYIPAYYDDTVVPTKTGSYALYNWYICQYDYAGYNYMSLNFAIGSAKAVPQNPSCQKVDVIRTAIKTGYKA